MEKTPANLRRVAASGEGKKGTGITLEYTGDPDYVCNVFFL